ncbi:phage virion morphogenesis protein [Cupriavidus oxalaticus]|uniref:Phage virion morphogenesis protein n=1 Tax=Cupriavidus oxalaticus TaxID=96344 RepID=A0ABX7HRQ9_9BURK|nr:phage virion morphogenesis protein [Cupriavidus oxalaticus]QRQ88511.1 phage virion morphogenesis protein [Cupriavidus oxalaticus]QRQ93163.1 phage virion morphogenesis protein [Cupriavidus oxalaticus]WQD81773.1 phage virion morphogenesis protein [Cupriavidus oxalaticus]
MNDLDELTAWASALLVKLEPAARRSLLREVATEMRRRQSARIAEQRNPDGTVFEPRKPQLRLRPGRVRRTMFNRLRTTRFMKVQSDPNSAVVTFASRALRIAEVHQYGLRDRVNKAGMEVQYARRELLGFADGDVERITDLVLAHLAA